MEGIPPGATPEHTNEDIDARIDEFQTEVDSLSGELESCIHNPNATKSEMDSLREKCRTKLGVRGEFFKTNLPLLRDPNISNDARKRLGSLFAEVVSPASNISISVTILENM